MTTANILLFTGAIESAKKFACSPAKALDCKPFCAQYWQWHHRSLMDAVRQYGLPSLFITLSPYEWSMPKVKIPNCTLKTLVHDFFNVQIKHYDALYHFYRLNGWQILCYNFIFYQQNLELVKHSTSFKSLNKLSEDF